jgi:hypothetical protein
MAIVVIEKKSLRRAREIFISAKSQETLHGQPVESRRQFGHDRGQTNGEVS